MSRLRVWESPLQRLPSAVVLEAVLCLCPLHVVLEIISDTVLVSMTMVREAESICSGAVVTARLKHDGLLTMKCIVDAEDIMLKIAFSASACLEIPMSCRF